MYSEFLALHMSVCKDAIVVDAIRFYGDVFDRRGCSLLLAFFLLSEKTS